MVFHATTLSPILSPDVWTLMKGSVTTDANVISNTGVSSDEVGRRMTNPKIITPSEAYELACCTGVESDGLPGGLYEFCKEVLNFWNAKPVNDESWVNLVFMLSSVFVAGMVYANS